MCVCVVTTAVVVFGATAIAVVVSTAVVLLLLSLLLLLIRWAVVYELRLRLLGLPFWCRRTGIEVGLLSSAWGKTG